MILGVGRMALRNLVLAHTEPLSVIASGRRSMLRPSEPMEGRRMSKPLVSDELWARVKPLIPKHHAPTEKGGRPPIDDRAALTGILFVLKTGIPWEDLPCEMECGCGMTCWRRLRDWQAAGVWNRLHEVLLAELNG